MKTITRTKLQEIAAAHYLHLTSDGKAGARADLSDHDLSGMDLSNLNLMGANLENADLTGANLTETKLDHANLIGAKGV